MAPFKKHLASPHQAKGTKITVHPGKGASEQPLTANPSMQNYAKATPMAQPQMAPPPPAGGMMPDDTD